MSAKPAAEMTDAEAREYLYQMAAKQLHYTRGFSIAIGDMQIGHLRNVINALTLDFHTAYRAAPYEIVYAAKMMRQNQPERHQDKARAIAMKAVHDFDEYVAQGGTQYKSQPEWDETC